MGHHGRRLTAVIGLWLAAIAASLTLGSATARSESPSTELTNQLARPATSLQIGMLMLERDLQASLESALAGSVTRLWGIQGVNVTIRSQSDGQLILIGVLVAGLRQNLEGTCRVITDILRVNLGVTGASGRAETVVGYFYDPPPRKRDSVLRLQRDLLERMHFLVRFDMPTSNGLSGDVSACSSRPL